MWCLGFSDGTFAGGWVRVLFVIFEDIRSGQPGVWADDIYLPAEGLK